MERNPIYNTKGPDEGNFSGQDFSKRPAAEFNDTIIFNCSFYHEAPADDDALSASPPSPMVDVFPPDMTGVQFVRCDLNNCVIPPGNTVDGQSSNDSIRVQNDLEDWKLDVDNKPVEPINKRLRERADVSVDPKDIPAVKLTREEFRAAQEVLNVRPAVEVGQ